MFAVLNRLRGTDGIFSVITSLFIGLVFYAITKDREVSILMAAGYVLGESMGWGKWIGGIINGITRARQSEVDDKEGIYNGIHYIANRLFTETEDYQAYCTVALAIRGFYWFFMVLLPLTLFGYIGPVFLFIGALILGIGFPLSVYLGNYTEDKFSIEYGYFSVKGAWEHSEVWYGLMQDIVLISIALYLI